MGKILLIGSGNASHALIPILTNKGHQVNILTSEHKALEFVEKLIDNDGISAYMPDGSILKGSAGVYYNAEEAMKDVDTIIIACPSNAYLDIIKSIAPYIKSGQTICVTPGQGGFHWILRSFIGNMINDLLLYALLPMPLNCRIRNFGKSVDVIALKENFTFAVYNSTDAKIIKVRESINSLLDSKSQIFAGNFVEATLYPINAVLHIGRMYEMFKDKKHLDMNPLFYEGMNYDSIKYMYLIEQELITISNKLGYILPTMFNFLCRFVYNDKSYDLLEFFTTNSAYQGLTSPVINIGTINEPEFVLDKDSRYLTEDVTHGLCVYKGIAELANINTPNIDNMIEFFQHIMNKEYIIKSKLVGKNAIECNISQNYGINTLEKLMENN